jgi:hypothetical protein
MQRRDWFPEIAATVMVNYVNLPATIRPVQTTPHLP